MSENYTESAGRHWADAEHLLINERRENADQLFGLAAECALKTALINPPAHPEPGALSRGYYLHVDELWDRVSLAAIPRQFSGLQALLKGDNPFHDWRVGQRYSSSGIVTEEAVARHRLFARRLLGAAHIVGQRGD